MDDEAREAERKKLEAARKRGAMYCRKCNGTFELVEPHSLGLPMVVVKCQTCGNEETRFQYGNRISKKAGK